jgi:hypothetical protein
MLLVTRLVPHVPVALAVATTLITSRDVTRLHRHRNGISVVSRPSWTIPKPVIFLANDVSVFEPVWSLVPRAGPGWGRPGVRS